VPEYRPMHFHYNNAVNGKHKFTIVLQNDSIVEAKSTINIEDTIHYLSWGKGENRIVIKPADTKEVYRLNRHGKKIIGIPMDSSWAFLSGTGRIRTYSITSDIETPIIGFIQKDEDGTIVPLTKENVEEFVKDNEKALALARKDKLIKAIMHYNKE
jgi:hypothetical protein